MITIPKLLTEPQNWSYNRCILFSKAAIISLQWQPCDYTVRLRRIIWVHLSIHNLKSVTLSLLTNSSSSVQFRSINFSRFDE